MFVFNQAAQLQAHEQQEKVQQEMMTIQIKYQREIDRLEKEIKNMRKQVLLRQDRNIAGKKQRKLKVRSRELRRTYAHTPCFQRSLIDMYSDVLDELNDYDTNYNIQDQLPRVNTIPCEHRTTTC